MAMRPTLRHARAVGAFNPTTQVPGFLLPLFGAMDGDNQTYIQRLVSPATIAGFDAVPWPERDSISFVEQTVAEIGGESLWSFVFPGEVPVVLPWHEFCTWMRGRIEDESLLKRPLLRFDIVDTLDLDDMKGRAYARAFEAYARIGDRVAEKWRDRAILEPALLAPIADRLASIDVAGRPASRLRARIERGRVIVELAGSYDSGIEFQLQASYEMLVERHGDLFPRNAKLDVVQKAQPPRPTIAKKLPRTTVLLVGKLRVGVVDHDFWRSRDVEVIDQDHFSSQHEKQLSGALLVILGAQRDWAELAAIGDSLSSPMTVIVTLATSMAPLVRDLDFQNRTAVPTVSVFSPYATTTNGRDPVKPIAALIDVMMHELEMSPSEWRRVPTPATHTMLIREPLWADQDEVEITCRLAARSLRAGAPMGATAKLYAQGGISDQLLSKCRHILAAVFNVQSNPEIHRVAARRATLLLLVERTLRYDPEGVRDRLHQGAQALFEMRGWRVRAQEGGPGVTIDDGERQFSAIAVAQPGEIPPEEHDWDHPGFGRAPLLIVHAHPRREQLLIGNRGQWFHIALEDVALMRPGTTWMWRVIRRHLLEWSTKPTLAALRLSAALAAEAIKLGRHQRDTFGFDTETIQRVLASDDCERFVDFTAEGLKRSGVALVISGVGSANQTTVHLTIEDDGPIVFID